MLHSISSFNLSSFKGSNVEILDRHLSTASLTSYWYSGCCPQTGAWLKLPRTPFIEAIARALMEQLSQDPRYNQEGKMYGVLLVETETGDRAILKAVSGQLHQLETDQWVPSIPGRHQVAFLEAQTLAQLETIKQELIQLADRPERSQYNQQRQYYAQQIQALKAQHQTRKLDRDRQRQQLQSTLSGEALQTALDQLTLQSQKDGIELRQLKRDRDRQLEPLQQTIAQADDRIRSLKAERKHLSQTLQTQMHEVYSVMNFLGTSASLQQLMPQGLPTGTGDCCAPKLLHYAAAHQLKPLAMAEFWWGTPTGDKLPGQFYAACEERCQPILGFLLSGLPQPQPVLDLRSPPILYQDDALLIIDKPTGLLSVPGRYGDLQDSAFSRLRNLLPDGDRLLLVHRLDKETSGILIFAKTPEVRRHLSQQFQQRQVHKIYEAILSGQPSLTEGVIDLPLRPNPGDRPRQMVDRHQGKPSFTQFRCLSTSAPQTRIEFMPTTGRTHQLRVHAQVGLGLPIWGDRLYGCILPSDRLHLHAREIQFSHPQDQRIIHIETVTPF
jgi:tRNA pseudouridine32 synthase / 23S rRNA pseudouridine746 synthase